jgi:hypothetical protein
MGSINKSAAVGNCPVASSAKARKGKCQIWAYSWSLVWKLSTGCWAVLYVITVYSCVSVNNYSGMRKNVRPLIFFRFIFLRFHVRDMSGETGCDLKPLVDAAVYWLYCISSSSTLCTSSAGWLSQCVLRTCGPIPQTLLSAVLTDSALQTRDTPLRTQIRAAKTGPLWWL